MVVCNAWYMNEISNTDRAMLALCSRPRTLSKNADLASNLFIKPTTVALGCPAKKFAEEIEDKVTHAIEGAFQ